MSRSLLIALSLSKAVIAQTRDIVPKYVFWVDHYPKTASGKIQKFKLQSFGKTLVAEGKGRTGGVLEKSSFT